MSESNLHQIFVNLAVINVSATSAHINIPTIDRQVETILNTPLPSGLTGTLANAVNGIRMAVAAWSNVRGILIPFFKECMATTVSYQINGATKVLLKAEINKLATEISNLETGSTQALAAMNSYVNNLESAVSQLATEIHQTEIEIAQDKQLAKTLQQQAHALHHKMKQDWWKFVIPGYNYYEIAKYVSMAKDAEKKADEASDELNQAEQLMNSMNALDPLTTNIKLLEGNLLTVVTSLQEANNKLESASELLDIHGNTVVIQALLKTVIGFLNEISQQAQSELGSRAG